MASFSSSPQRTVEEDTLTGIGHQPQSTGFSQSSKLWDVFINHRGPDVKETLVLRLYKSLENLGFRAFLDREEMELGDFFPSTIQDAIRFASLQIAIFSKGYADSAWCLTELDLMLESKKKIIPIFYDVAPLDLRHLQTGAYANSFSKHKEKGRHLDKLDNWEKTLHHVSLITGYEMGRHASDLEKLCEKVVSVVRQELEKTRLLDIAKYPVGIKEIHQDFEGTCWQGTERTRKIISIYGLGGSGKTTLATSFFNRLRSGYTESSFLFEVRETSNRGQLTSLQSKLLKDLVHEDRTFHSISEGSSYLRSRLGRGPHLRFLICIDDIDHPEQLHDLVGWDSGDNVTSSLIIVTSRDERVLIRAGISARYKMKEMNISHSTELFCWHAFHQPYPLGGYGDLVKSFVKECGGLPLSLQVLGGLVFDSAGPSESYWKMVLDKVRRSLPKDIEQKLMISVDALDDEQKQIFIDIACFFVHRSSHMARRIWEGTGWSAEHTLQTLIDKCLVEVYMGSNYWTGFDSGSIPLLRMHDHIRDLGRKIADQISSPCRLWRPKHLHSQEVKGFQSILAESADNSLRCLNSIFDVSTTFEFRYFLGNSNDFDDKSTSLLWLELDMSLRGTLDELGSHEEEHMNSVPSPGTMPSWVPLHGLQYLKICNGHLGRLWRQAPFHLKELVLDGTILEEFPNSLGMLSHLEDLVVRGRAEWNGTEWNNRMQIDGRSFSDSLIKLTNLRGLVLRDLALSGELTLNNRRESTTLASPTVSLQSIDIRDVKLLSKVIISAEYLRSLKYLHLESMENLIEVGLGLVATRNCWDLAANAKPNCLEKIIIEGCWTLQKIEGIEKLEGLKYLQISASSVAVSRCIDTWQRLPSQVASVIWNPAVETLLSVSRSDLERCIGEDGTVTEILPPQTAKRRKGAKIAKNVICNPAVTAVETLSFLSNPAVGTLSRVTLESCIAEYELDSELIAKPRKDAEIDKKKRSQIVRRHKIVLPVTAQPGAIIIFMMIRSIGKDCQKVLKMPLLDWTVSSIAGGLNAVTVVVTDEEKINKMLYGVSDWIPTVTAGKVENGFIITINQIQKLEALWNILKAERTTELQERFDELIVQMQMQMPLRIRMPMRMRKRMQMLMRMKIKLKTELQ